MVIGLLRISLLAVLAGALGVQAAHADIYTWVDASGAINVSNLAPPDGVTVTHVIRASDPGPGGDQGARDAQVRALTERVGQLEDEVEMAQRQVRPPLPYPAMPPPLVEYVVNVAPPPVQYEVNAPPSPAPGCDSSWMDCGLGWVPVFYPAGIVLLRPPYFPRSHPFQGGRRFAAQQPMPHAVSGAWRRG